MTATYPTTGSTLNSTISTGLSTQVLVKVENETVGAIQSIEVTHTRPLERVREVGTDGTLEIVPNRPCEYTLSVTRIVFDRLSLPEAFARGFMNIKSQLLPFDIQIIDRTNGDGDASIIHTCKNCWFADYKPSFRADAFILQQQATLWCEDISTTQGTSQNSAVQGGARGINFQSNDRERQTDTGAGGTSSGGSTTTAGSGFRGTMDVSGIINAAFK